MRLLLYHSCCNGTIAGCLLATNKWLSPNFIHMLHCFDAIGRASGFVEPGAIYHVDLDSASPAPELFRATQLKVPHNPDDYEVHQVSGRQLAYSSTF